MYLLLLLSILFFYILHEKMSNIWNIIYGIKNGINILEKTTQCMYE